MSAPSTKVFEYLKDKYNICSSETKIAQMMRLYLKKENQQQIDKTMLLLYGESFSEIITSSSSYEPNPTSKQNLNEIIKGLKEKIRILDLEVKHLTEDKEELRTNYWNLKESINKTKQSKRNFSV